MINTDILNYFLSKFGFSDKLFTYSSVFYIIFMQPCFVLFRKENKLTLIYDVTGTKKKKFLYCLCHASLLHLPQLLRLKTAWQVPQNPDASIYIITLRPLVLDVFLCWCLTTKHCSLLIDWRFVIKIVNDCFSAWNFQWKQFRMSVYHLIPILSHLPFYLSMLLLKLK